VHRVRRHRLWPPALSGLKGCGWLASACLCGCAAPLVKPEAFDPDVLARVQLRRGNLIAPDPDGRELLVADSVEWMRLRPGDDLTFVGLRPESGKIVYCLALECAPERDFLAVVPLQNDETPLTVLANRARRDALATALQDYRKAPASVAGVIQLSLRELIAQKRLGPPISDVHRVLAVAANYPSHLECDLATDPAFIPTIAKTPPRLFQKHPPQPPPGTVMPSDLPFRGVIGPFDDIVYPELTWLPKDEHGTSNSVPTALDYEVELGIVIGRTLTADEVLKADDATLYAAVAGYLLVSDVKARNPQVYERALARKQSPKSWAGRYLTGDADSDLILGNWDADTCAWWGYAASLGDFTAVGPYFVASNGNPAMPPHDLLCARSYGSDQRYFPIPGGRQADRFYLRQCSRASEETTARDCLLWRVPQILRAALDPIGALAPAVDANVLHPGDVIALGTPGGITLTVRGRAFYRFLGFLLFWWDARDWHDAFFGKDVANYLHQGDRLLLWGEGLGCQRLAIRRISWPPPPGVVPEGKQ
jgi:2-keto-4-pentenoate hydratase/2-oxohepta-3-ene-1,7-dioic acid hydratase in catechol pathway